MQAHLGTIVCKFGRDPVMFVVEVAICAKTFTDRWTDRQRTPRDCISSWNELEFVIAYARTLGRSIDSAAGAARTLGRSVYSPDIQTRDRHDLPASQPK